MLKLLKSFFGAKNAHSTPLEWTDESWSASAYEKMLTSGNITAASSLFSGHDGLTDPGSSMQHGPSVNIDGTPMMGSFDMNGNPFGVTSSATSDFGDHAFNIDGTPMMGSVDIHGNPFGVTSGAFDSGFDSGGGWSSSDSFGSSWSSGGDSFGSTGSWSSDNHF